MITFFDLIQQEQFRDYVCHRLVEHTEDSSYSFQTPFPTLYKYKALSEYAVNDIVNGRLSLTSIGDFNDMFDGAMHKYGTEKNWMKMAEHNWEEIKKQSITAGLPEGLLNHSNIVSYHMNRYKTGAKRAFILSDYLGTYIGSLSAVNDSILMWSHYTQENSGICIEYDFDQLPPGDLLRDTIFPVSYSRRPIELTDLLEDKNGDIYKYSIDAALLCAALSKADIWDYEQEWRIIFLLDKGSRHIPINIHMLPRSICFGYHFLKPMFYYDDVTEKQDEATKRIENLVRLIDFMADREICAKMMVPIMGTYGLKPHSIKIEKLKSFIAYHFRDNKPNHIRFYYAIHEGLMEIVEESEGNPDA